MTSMSETQSALQSACPPCTTEATTGRPVGVLGGMLHVGDSVMFNNLAGSDVAVFNYPATAFLQEGRRSRECL